MMTEQEKKKFNVTRLIAIGLLVVMPLLYFAIVKGLQFPSMNPAANELLFQILIIVALLQPVMIPVIEKTHIQLLKKNKALNPTDAFMLLMIIRCSIIEAIYLFGVITYFNTYNLTSMLYFYPIGIIATIVYFPRESTYETFKEKLQAP
jgi:hypothetical protein